MPRPRFNNLTEEKQDRIIDAAGSEFADKGYLAASINTIIDEADISKGTFYYYFDNKADLFATVVAHVTRAILGGDDLDYSKIGVDEFWPSMRDLNHRSVAYSREHPWIWEVARNVHDAPDELAPVVAPHLEAMQSVLVNFLIHGQKLGLIRNDIPMDLLVVIVSSLDRSIDRWLIEKHTDLSPDEIADIGDKLMRMTERMLAPPEDGDGT